MRREPLKGKRFEKDFSMPTKRAFRCDNCQRRKPSNQAVVEGIYVYCRKCTKERRARAKKQKGLDRPS